jgi:PadR family transcriptional regulator PadR
LGGPNLVVSHLVVGRPAARRLRRVRFYRLTRAGRRQLLAEAPNWEQTTALIGRFFTVKPEDLQ